MSSLDLSISVRLELHGFQERISSLRAGLRTWLDHLHRLQALAAEYATKVNVLCSINLCVIIGVPSAGWFL